MVEIIVNQIREKTGFAPEIGVILGSGWGDAVTEMENPEFIEYSSLKGMPRCTVKGHNGRFALGKLYGAKVCVMQGRFHLYEGREPSEVVLPIAVMKGLGIKTLLLTNAAGGINTSFNVGDLMLISDHLNLSGENPLVGLTATETSPIFIDMGECYSPGLLAKVSKALNENGIDIKEGTYVQFKGPSYETKAEVRMARALGGDAVGMSTAVETVYARFLKLDTLAISCITNMAAGVKKEKLMHEDVLKVSKGNSELFKRVLKTVLPALSGTGTL